jgi:threonylcarbamoyladenosine tRNA methylthiotransferase MtaB
MKIYLDSIGCRLNQSEIELYARQFRCAGHTLVATPDDADLAVINTCNVTNAAESDSRSKIRQMARAGTIETVVTGCWSTLNPEIALSLPGVSQVVPNAEKDHLVSDLLQIPQEKFELEPLSRELIPGTRQRTRAFIKVQDGCDNRCTFCVTTIARGPGRSRSESEVLADVRAALVSGSTSNSAAKEIVLTGVHLGSWGQDFSSPLHLRHLVERILVETEVPRLRLSSLEPWDLDDEFFTLWEDPRLCRHLHLPLQSGSSTTLRRMARKTNPTAYADLLNAARRACPDFAITTDLIAGFPGETENEFLETWNFVKEMNFATGHVFTYSPRPGTSAATMPDQVPFQLRKERNAQLRSLLSESSQAYQLRFLGSTLPVLWETATPVDAGLWQLRGLTDNYLRVRTQTSSHLWNKITPVRLTSFSSSDIEGHIVN